MHLTIKIIIIFNNAAFTFKLFHICSMVRGRIKGTASAIQNVLLSICGIIEAAWKGILLMH